MRNLFFLSLTILSHWLRSQQSNDLRYLFTQLKTDPIIYSYVIGEKTSKTANVSGKKMITNKWSARLKIVASENCSRVHHRRHNSFGEKDEALQLEISPWVVIQNDDSFVFLSSRRCTLLANQVPQRNGCSSIPDRYRDGSDDEITINNSRAVVKENPFKLRYQPKIS